MGSNLKIQGLQIAAFLIAFQHFDKDNAIKLNPYDLDDPKLYFPLFYIYSK